MAAAGAIVAGRFAGNVNANYTSGHYSDLVVKIKENNERKFRCERSTPVDGSNTTYASAAADFESPTDVAELMLAMFET